MDRILMNVWCLAWVQICLLTTGAAQTESPELLEALDLASGRALVSAGSTWSVEESGAHDGEDVAVVQTQSGSIDRLTVIPDHGGTLRFWSRLSGSLTVHGSDIRQHLWEEETRAWELHEVLVSSLNKEVRWQAFGNDTQAWIDEVEMIPTIPVSEALDTDHPVKLDGLWAGYATAQSSDHEDHLHIFGKGRLDTAVVGPGVLQFRARGIRNRLSIRVNDEWIGNLNGNSEDWETVTLQIPQGRHELIIRNSGSWAGIDSLRWAPGAHDPALKTVAPNSTFGSIMGTLQPSVEVIPSQQPNLGKRLRFGDGASTLPDDEVAVSDMTMHVKGPGHLSFWWNMQQGAPNATNLTVDIDDKRQATLSQFSGGWQKFTATLTPGEHRLQIRYHDLRKAAGSQAWLADLKIIASPTIALGEAVDAPELPWWTGGVQAWAGYASLDAPNGPHLAASGYGGSRRLSWIATSVTGPGVLRCRWRCTGASGRETLTFEDNGKDRIAIDADLSLEWQLLEAEIPQGEHILRWVFEGSYGSDDQAPIPSAGWIDAVDYTPGPLPIQKALSSNLAFAHLGQWTVVPDGSGGLALQTEIPGAPLTFLIDGPGNLAGRLHANNNNLDVYNNERRISTLGLESEWRSFLQPLEPYEDFVYRLERDMLDNNGVIRLGELRFNRNQQFNALEQAAEIPKSVHILHTEEGWTIDDTMSQEGNTSIVGSSTLRLRIPGPGILKFHAKALMKPSTSASEPSLRWAYDSGIAPPPLAFDPALDTWQTLTIPVLEPWTLFITGNKSGLAVDGFEFIPATLNEHVENHELSLSTGGDEPWYSLTSDESPDGINYLFRRDGSGIGWIETEVTGPTVLTLNSADTVDFVVGEAFAGTLDQGYSELSIPAGEHLIRFTADEGMIWDMQQLSTPSLSEALDLGAHRYVSVSERHEFVHGASAFDGEDALSLPEGGRLSIGFLENGYAGYWSHEGLQWQSANEAIESTMDELIAYFSGPTLVDRLSIRQPQALSASDWPVPLTTSTDTPWTAVPFAGVPDGDDVSLGTPDRGWLEATVEGPGELWFASRQNRIYINGAQPLSMTGYTTDWAQQRYGFGDGTHRIRWMAGSKLSSVDDIKWFPRNMIAEALDIAPLLVAIAPIVQTSETGGIDGGDALHLIGTMRFSLPSSGILSWWWRDEGNDEWHRELRPITTAHGSISGDGIVIDRLEILESPSLQEALDTDLNVEIFGYHWAVDLGDHDFAFGTFRILTPSQGIVTYRTQSNDEWLTASLSGATAFPLIVEAEYLDQVEFSPEADPFAQAIEWLEYGPLKTLGWEVESDPSFKGGDALKAVSSQARLEVQVEGPGTLIFYAKSEGIASVNYPWENKRDLGNGWTQVVQQIDWTGSRSISITPGIDSRDPGSWGFWVDNLTFVPHGSIDSAAALDTTLPHTLSQPDLWQGQASLEAEDGDSLHLIGTDDLSESSITVMVEGPGTFSFIVRSDNDETVSVHRGTTLMLPPTEVDEYIFTKMEMPIPAGSHEMVIRFFKEDQYYSPNPIGIELDDIRFTPQSTPPLRGIIKGPIEMVTTSLSGTSISLSQDKLSLQPARLYLHSNQSGRLAIEHIGRFGIGPANTYYHPTVRRADWGLYEYHHPSGTTVIDPRYRFNVSVSLDPAAYPRIRSIVFEPEIPAGDLSDGLDVQSTVTVVSGDWETQAFGDSNTTTDSVYGETLNGSAAIETQMQGPGLLKFRLHLGPHFQTSMKLFIDGVERWEATHNEEWLEAATPLTAGMHTVRWQLISPRLQGNISLDAVEVVEPYENFLTPFGLNAEAPAVRWQKLASSGEQPAMRGNQFGPFDSGLSLRLNGPVSVAYDQSGNLSNEPAAWQVSSGDVPRFPQLNRALGSEYSHVPPGPRQIEWSVVRGSESQAGEAVELSNIRILPLEPLSDFNEFAFQSSPALTWQQLETTTDKPPGLVSFLTSGSSTLTSTVEGPGTLTFDWSQSSARPSNRFTCRINGEIIAQLDGDIEKREGLTYHLLHDLGEGSHEIQWRAETNGGNADTIVFRLDNLNFEAGTRPLETTFLNVPAMRSLMGSSEGWEPSPDPEHASPTWQTRGPGFAKLTFDLPSAGTLSGQMRLYRDFEETRVLVYKGFGSPSDTFKATLNNTWIGSADTNFGFGFSDWKEINVSISAGKHELQCDYQTINAVYNRAFLEGWQFNPIEAQDNLAIADAADYEGALTSPTENQWLALSDPELPNGDALMVGISNAPKTNVLEAIVQGPGEISFSWKADPYAGELDFHLGDDAILSYDRNNYWSSVTRTIPAGQHTARWTFTGSRATSGLPEPAALIDQIGFRQHNHLQEALGLDDSMLVTSISAFPAWTIESDWTPEGDLSVVFRRAGTMIIDVPPPFKELTLSITGSGRVGSDERASAYPSWRTITVEPDADTGQVHLTSDSSFFAVARFEEALSTAKALDTQLDIETDITWVATKPPSEQRSVLQSTGSGHTWAFVRGPGELQFRWKNPATTPARFFISGYSVRSIYVTNEWVEEVVQIPEGSHRIAWESKGPLAELDRLRYLPLGARETFDQWAASFALTDSKLADPNTDGIPNLLAYAFALDPTVYGALQTASGVTGSLPESHIRTRRDGDWLEMSYLRRHDSGLIYVPKFSSDLSTWSSQTSKTTAIDMADGWEMITVRDAVPIPSNGRRFGQVEVSETP